MNLTEKLNKIDHYCLDNDKKFYDLKSLYEAVKPRLSDTQKAKLEKVVKTRNPKLIEKTLRKFENKKLTEDLDLADKNQLSYYYLQTVRNSLNTYGDKLSKDDVKSAMGFAVDDFDTLKNEVLYGEVSDWVQGEDEYDESLKEDWETFESKRDELLKHAHPDYTDALKNLDPYSDENYWEEVRSKQVMDSDGFWTDYTLYYNEWTEEYVAVFGDSDLYRPEDENWDAGPFDTEEEALEWFNSYNGFDGSDDDAYDDWQMGNVGKFNKYKDDEHDEPLPFESFNKKENPELKESSKKDFIDAYTWAYGANKKEAQKAYKEFDPESREELVYGFKGNAKKSFLTDSLHEHIWTATDVVRDLYDKFPKVEFLDERDVDDDKVALFFKFGGDVSGLEDLVKSYNCDYKISNGKIRIIAPEDEDYDECLKESLWDEKLHAVIRSEERPQLVLGSNGGYKTINVRDKLDWFTTNSADEMYEELKDFYTDPYYKDCTCTISGKGWSVDLKDFLKEYESGNKMTEKYSKKLKEGIVKFSPEDELEFEKLIEDFGWEIEDKGKTWLGSTHYQIINPKVQVFSEKSFDKAVETYIEPFVQEIDNFKKEEGSPITWSFGVNKDGYMTAGIDLHNR